MLYNENMSQRLTENNFSGAAIGEPVYIGENVSVMSGSVIESGSVIDNKRCCKGRQGERICWHRLGGI